MSRTDPVDAGRIASRGQGERGSGLVVAITSLFAFTFLGLVWLAHDVDRAVSNESAAQSIAFQAARAAAQSTDVSSLRSGAVAIDPELARQAASVAAERLFDSYRVDGALVRCDVSADGSKVTVEVTITDTGVTTRGVGIVSAERTE